MVYLFFITNKSFYLMNSIRLQYRPCQVYTPFIHLSPIGLGRRFTKLLTVLHLQPVSLSTAPLRTHHMPGKLTGSRPRAGISPKSTRVAAASAGRVYS